MHTTQKTLKYLLSEHNVDINFIPSVVN